MAQPSFPLPKGYFGDVQLSAADHAHYRELVAQELASALQEEYDFVHTRKRQVDTSTWKYVARKHQLQIFRHRNRTATVHGSKMPYLLSVGKTEATIEDLLFEVYCKTHEEMKIAGLLVAVGCKDCTVLNTYETATDEDPYHCATLKWQLSKFPVGRKRDWCYIEALGINKDAQGERYGYLVLQSVERRECPPFSHKSAVRGKVFFAFIYRQLDPGTVGIYSRGLFEPAGELIQQLSLIGAASILTGMTSILCAEAKKLTLLAMANRCSMPSRAEPKCSICSKGSSLRVSLRVCQICYHTACSKCLFKKHLFVPRQYDWVRVDCCSNCIIRAKNMQVRPAEPEFSIGAIVNSARSSTAHNFSLNASLRSPSTSSSDGLKRTDQYSRIGSSQSSQSVDSSMTEEEMVAIIAQAMQQGGRKSLQDPRRSTESLENVDLPNEFQVDPTPQFPTLPSSRRNSTASDHQEALYNQLLQLQLAAKQVHATTQANGDLMQRM